jgi:hypothetical protein
VGTPEVPIDKSYFQRQAPLLRKMIRLTQNILVADRLSEMARDYEMKASEGADKLPPQTPNTKADGDD